MQVLSTQGERTNDIARSVQNGDTDILVLWLACRRLVMQTARRWHRAFNGSRGVVLDDLGAGGLSGAHEGGGNLESGQRRVFHMAHVPTENSFCGSIFYAYRARPERPAQ